MRLFKRENTETYAGRVRYLFMDDHWFHGIRYREDIKKGIYGCREYNSREGGSGAGGLNRAFHASLFAKRPRFCKNWTHRARRLLSSIIRWIAGNHDAVGRGEMKTVSERRMNVGTSNDRDDPWYCVSSTFGYGPRRKLPGCCLPVYRVDSFIVG